jgi:hypothetical protein
LLVEPNRREKDLVKEEQTKTETEPRVRTCYHHRTTGDLDYGGAEGNRRSSHHHLAILHHDERFGLRRDEIGKKSCCCSLLRVVLCMQNTII